MRTWVKVLAWYTIVIIALQVILGPITVGMEPLAGWEVVVGTVLALPILAFAILTLIVVRRP